MRYVLPIFLLLGLVAPAPAQDLLSRVKQLEDMNSQNAAALKQVQADVAAMKTDLSAIKADIEAIRGVKTTAEPQGKACGGANCKCPTPCTCGPVPVSATTGSTLSHYETMWSKAEQAGMELRVGVGMDPGTGNFMVCRSDGLQDGISGPHIVVGAPVNGKLMWVNTIYPADTGGSYGYAAPVYYSAPMFGGFGGGGCAGGRCAGGRCR